MTNEKVSEMRETIEVENGSRAAGLQNIKDGQQTQPSEISGLKAMIKDILRGFGNLQKGCTEMSKSLRQTLAGNTAMLRADKVRQGEYALQDHAKGFEIVRSRPWNGAFLPGQRVDMSRV